MLIQEMFNTRQSDLATAERTIRQRMQWQEIERIEKLEHQLHDARMRFDPATAAPRTSRTIEAS